MANRRDMAKAHARRKWKCPICEAVCRGNGGRASHQRKHIRQAGLVIHGNTLPHREAWLKTLRKHEDDRTATCNGCGAPTQTCVCFECVEDVCEDCNPNSDQCVSCLGK